MSESFDEVLAKELIDRKSALEILSEITWTAPL
jgi:predicted CopG family antitoxin